MGVNHPLTHSSLLFDTRCTMKNDLLSIKINSLFKTQLEAFTIKSKNFTNPEMINFLTGPEQCWNFSIILVALGWPVLCSQSIFLKHSAVLGCLVLMLSRSVWLSVGTAAHTPHSPPFKYLLFLFRPLESKEYFLAPTLPVVNSWYPLYQQEERKKDRVYVYFVRMNPSAMCANALVLKNILCVLHFQTTYCSAATNG